MGARPVDVEELPPAVPVPVAPLLVAVAPVPLAESLPLPPEVWEASEPVDEPELLSEPPEPPVGLGVPADDS